LGNNLRKKRSDLCEHWFIYFPKTHLCFWLLCFINILIIRILVYNYCIFIQLSRGPAKCHLQAIRVLQAKILRAISGAEWFVRSRELARDLEVPFVGDVLNDQSSTYCLKLLTHPTHLPGDFVTKGKEDRRLYPQSLRHRTIT